MRIQATDDDRRDAFITYHFYASIILIIVAVPLVSLFIGSSWAWLVFAIVVAFFYLDIIYQMIKTRRHG